MDARTELCRVGRCAGCLCCEDVDVCCGDVEVGASALEVCEVGDDAGDGGVWDGVAGCAGVGLVWVLGVVEGDGGAVLIDCREEARGWWSKVCYGEADSIAVGGCQKEDVMRGLDEGENGWDTCPCPRWRGGGGWGTPVLEWSF